MSSLLSSSWYRVASLKPKLHTHFEVHRQHSGNELVFLLQDHSLGKFYRFNISTYDILSRMDGVRTVHDIWEASVTCLGEDAPTQDDTIELLGRLHRIDGLKMNVTPDCVELFQRAQLSRKSWWKTTLKAPLSMRFPLLDPDRLLSAMMPIVSPVLSFGGLLLWSLTIILAVVLAAMHWSELSHGGVDQILDPGNLLLLLLVYPVVKTLHELGHAITTRKWGGEVHEIGITFLVFMPVPYVDASAMASIASKYRRMLVSASGMMVELFLAAIALLIWINVEPGLLRLTAFNVMLVCGVSTLVFNGNPLLRFDAYYILKDAIGIPNLASRSTRYLAYLAQRYLCGEKSADSPVNRREERYWLFFYGAAAAIFRVAMTFAIVIFVAGQYFVIGIVLAIWATALLIVSPAVKLVYFVLFNQALAQHRKRSILGSLSVLSGLCGIVFLAPVPSATQAQGVLWLPDQAHILAGTDGIINELLAEPSEEVKQGQALLTMTDPLLRARIKFLETELDELLVRYRIKNLSDRVQAAIVDEQINSKQAELDRARQRAEQLTIHSSSNGELVLRRANQMTGRYVRQGDRLGFVLDRGAMTVRVVVPQSKIGLIREVLVGVDVKLADSLHDSIPASLTRGVPAAQQMLPSKVLGREGGGSISVDPSDKQGLRTLQSVFELDLTLRDQPDVWRIGQRAYVKFDHGNQPLAEQWFRQARQLFIRRLGV